MNFLIRVFVYSVALTLFVVAWMMEPETAQFKDLLAFSHTPIFWKMVGAFAVVQIAASITFPRRNVTSAPALRASGKIEAQGSKP